MQRVVSFAIEFMMVLTGVIVALGVPAVAASDEKNEAVGPVDESFENVFVEIPGTQPVLPQPKLLIGERAPAIAAWTLSGDVYDYQPPDRTVLLSFWSMKDPSYSSYYEHVS